MPYTHKRRYSTRSEEPVRPALAAMEVGDVHVFLAANPETVRSTCTRLAQPPDAMRFCVHYRRADGSVEVTRTV